MKKNKLEIEYSYDFDLVGLTTSAKAYKLAWELNQQLRIRLLKKPDLSIPVRIKEKEEATYSLHVHETAHNILRLFKNKPNEPHLSRFLLVPEHPHIDYIIMIQGEELNSNRLQEDLRGISSIEWVAFIPLEPLKSKDNFIF